jgi:hypothetical protein
MDRKNYRENVPVAEAEVCTKPTQRIQLDYEKYEVEERRGSPYKFIDKMNGKFDPKFRDFSEFLKWTAEGAD